MKKILLILMALTICILMCACGNDEKENSSLVDASDSQTDDPAQFSIIGKWRTKIDFFAWVRLNFEGELSDCLDYCEVDEFFFEMEEEYREDGVLVARMTVTDEQKEECLDILKPAVDKYMSENSMADDDYSLMEAFIDLIERNFSSNVDEASYTYSDNVISITSEDVVQMRHIEHKSNQFTILKIETSENVPEHAKKYYEFYVGNVYKKAK